MADLNPQQRGYAFERFLMSLFDLFDMSLVSHSEMLESKLMVASHSITRLI